MHRWWLAGRTADERILTHQSTRLFQQMLKVTATRASQSVDLFLMDDQVERYLLLNTPPCQERRHASRQERYWQWRAGMGGVINDMATGRNPRHKSQRS